MLREPVADRDASTNLLPVAESQLIASASRPHRPTPSVKITDFIYHISHLEAHVKHYLQNLGRFKE